MPAHTGKSNILAKLGNDLDKAMRAHANDPVTYGAQTVPPGIINGIAQLDKAYLGEIKSGEHTGKPFVRMSGVVLEPELVEHKGAMVSARGCQTSVMFSLYPTAKQTLDEAVARLMNEFKKFGLDVSDAGAGDLEGLLETLTEAKPFFRFSTRMKTEQGTNKPLPDAEPWQDWYGTRGLENYVPPDDTAGNVDETATAPASPPPPPPPKKTAAAAPPPPPPPPAPAAAKKPAAKPAPKKEEPDLDALGEAANNGDEAAIAKVNELALGLGYSQAQIDEMPSWLDVAAKVKAGEGPEAGGEDAAVPTVGDPYKYKPAGAKRPIDCEVTDADADAGTVTLKSLVDNKTVYKDVPLAQLIGWPPE